MIYYNIGFPKGDSPWYGEMSATPIKGLGKNVTK